jgi:hypothetical protein
MVMRNMTQRHYVSAIRQVLGVQDDFHCTEAGSVHETTSLLVACSFSPSSCGSSHVRIRCSIGKENTIPASQAAQHFPLPIVQKSALL